MKRMDWFRCFPGKWLGALSGMKADEGYLYLVICFRIYEVSGPCIDNDDVLALRTHLRKARIAELIGHLIKSGKLYRQGGGLMNAFAAEQLQERVAYKHKLSLNGTRGAFERWEKDKEKQQSDDSQAMFPEWQTDAHTHIQRTEVTKTEEKKEDSRSSTPIWPSEAFELFWETYPKQVAKLAARKAFAKLQAKPPLEWNLFIEAVRKYSQYTQARNEPQYVKHPATWLNAGCWDDQQPMEGGNGQGRSRALQDDSRSLVKAAQRLADKARRGEFEFTPRPGSAEYYRRMADEAGGNIVPMLPPRGSG